MRLKTEVGSPKFLDRMTEGLQDKKSEYESECFMLNPLPTRL
jgi:hypothetical protein